MNIKDDFILSQINEGYLVGGAIRDRILFKNCDIYDRDIAIKGAENFASKIAENFEGTLITLDSENQIFRVVLKDKNNYLDISELRGETIEKDLLERDFTINALAYDLKNDKIIDTTGGLDDLKNSILRGINPKNFEDDPLRILRAFRFMATTGFEFSTELEDTLKQYLPLAMNPAKERISYEIMKLFGGKYASRALLKMDEIGLLEKIFPCVIDMKKVPPNSHHHLDLFHHVVETVRQIEFLYDDSSREVKEHLNHIDFGGFPRLNHIKLAAFLHDIGKFSTWTIEGGKCNKLDGESTNTNVKLCQSYTKICQTCNCRHRFIKHDDVGSKMVIPLLKDLKFSKKQIEYLSSMIKNHIYPSNILAAPDLNEKVLMRYIRKMENNVIDNIILAKADRLSARGIEITEEVVNENLDGLTKLQNFYLEKKETLRPLPKLIDGKEIMSIRNIKPSPELGIIIRALQEAQLNGDVLTEDEAKNFVKSFVIN